MCFAEGKTLLALRECLPSEALAKEGCPCLVGTALYGAVRRVVWDRGVNYSPGPDSAIWVFGRQ